MQKGADVIEVEPVEDGGNPRDPAAIRRVADSVVRVAPFSEDGDANYKFALNVGIRNDGSEPAPLTVEMDWGEAVYTRSRDFVHIGSGNNWTYLSAAVEGARTVARCDVPPGLSFLGLSPAYGVADHQAAMRTLPAGTFQRQEIGRSARGRPIEAFHTGSGARRIVVTARFHPYETAASFCVEGLMRWLGEAGAAQERLLASSHLVLVPFPNPDGVYLGMCKRTRVGGVDLSHEAAGNDDPEARALIGVIDELRPDLFLDIHGWMHADEDGLHYYDEALAERFLQNGADYQAFAENKWKGTLERPNPASPRWYAAQRYGSAALAVSYRWPGRTVEQMRALGPATLQAVV